MRMFWKTFHSNDLCTLCELFNGTNSSGRLSYDGHTHSRCVIYVSNLRTRRKSHSQSHSRLHTHTYTHTRSYTQTQSRCYAVWHSLQSLKGAVLRQGTGQCDGPRILDPIAFEAVVPHNTNTHARVHQPKQWAYNNIHAHIQSRTHWHIHPRNTHTYTVIHTSATPTPTHTQAYTHATATTIATQAPPELLEGGIVLERIRQCSGARFTNIVPVEAVQAQSATTHRIRIHAKQMGVGVELCIYYHDGSTPPYTESESSLTHGGRCWVVCIMHNDESTPPHTELKSMLHTRG